LHHQEETEDRLRILSPSGTLRKTLEERETNRYPASPTQEGTAVHLPSLELP
jgi:hypothetical protein